MRKSVFGALSSCIMVMSFSTSEASLLTWKLTGEVERVSESLSHIFSIGESVEYIFTFDSSTLDTNSDPVRGNYSNAISNATITVGSYTASIENYDIEIHNNSDWGAQPEDKISFDVISNDTVLNGTSLLGSDNRVYGFGGVGSSFNDQDGTPNMLLSDSLPISPQGISNQATGITFGVNWYAQLNPYSRLGAGINATNIQLTDITPVPIPPAVFLFGSGLIGLISFGRNK